MKTGLARELRRLRLDKNLRRDELAQLARLDVRTVTAIEQDGNAAKVKTIEALAVALGTPPAPLLELRRKLIANRARGYRRKLNGPTTTLLALALAILLVLLGIECADLLILGHDWGFPPGLGHPAEHTDMGAYVHRVFDWVSDL